MKKITNKEFETGARRNKSKKKFTTRTTREGDSYMIKRII